MRPGLVRRVLRSKASGRSVHPTLQTLALYTRGDLQWTVRWRTGRHVTGCEACERQVSVFRAAQVELKREANEQTLTAFEAIVDWPRLEREMLGNIAVGVAAARCIEKVPGRSVLRSRGLWAAAGLVALFIGGWFTHIPKEQNEHLLASLRRMVGLRPPAMTGTIVETTPDGIAVRTQTATFTIMHPPSATVSLAGSSAVAARYIDEETGLVTITHVYGQ